MESKKVHVALIRGINVGRAKRVAMGDLRALVESLGYRDVRTLLNSGNVVFTARAGAANAAARIEKGLASEIGVPARVIVLSPDEMDEIVEGNPFGSRADNPSRLLVAVVGDPTTLRKLAPVEKEDWGTAELAVGTRAAYMWCPEGLLAGKLVEAAGRALGDGATTRNWATITKLHGLMTGATPTPERK